MSAADEILLAQANERLRQEQETFNQQKDHDRRSFRAQNAMAWVVTFTLPAILAIATCIIFFHKDFDPTTVKIATSALLVDGLGAAISIYKSGVGRAPKHALAPVTAQPKLPAVTRTRGARSVDHEPGSEVPQPADANG